MPSFHAATSASHHGVSLNTERRCSGDPSPKYTSLAALTAFTFALSLAAGRASTSSCVHLDAQGTEVLRSRLDRPLRLLISRRGRHDQHLLGAGLLQQQLVDRTAAFGPLVTAYQCQPTTSLVCSFIRTDSLSYRDGRDVRRDDRERAVHHEPIAVGHRESVAAQRGDRIPIGPAARGHVAPHRSRRVLHAAAHAGDRGVFDAPAACAARRPAVRRCVRSAALRSSTRAAEHNVATRHERVVPTELEPVSRSRFVGRHVRARARWPRGNAGVPSAGRMLVDQAHGVGHGDERSCRPGIAPITAK